MIVSEEMPRTVLLGLFTVPVCAGPPFQADGPQPIDFRNYEFYMFASADGTPLEFDTTRPGASAPGAGGF
jgi:hypothetical protein